MTPKDQAIASIARDILRIDTLETRHRDRLDFHDVSVSSVKAALEAAYDFGVAAAAIAAAPKQATPARPMMPADPAVMTAAQFCAGMMGIWDGDVHRQYREWGDALRVLDAIGAVEIGARHFGGEPSLVYRLPAGERVMVAGHGSAARHMEPGELDHEVVLKPATAVLLEGFVSPGARLDDSQRELLSDGRVAVPVDAEVMAAIEADRTPGETDDEVVARLIAARRTGIAGEAA